MRWTAPLAVLLLAVTVRGCPYLCTCNQNTVICTGQGLTKVPSDIPPDTHRLDLQENKISVIRKDDLAALGQLKILRLNRNRLRSLPDGAFTYNKLLHRVDLSENFLSVLTDEQLQGPKHMRNLQLDRNLLTCLETRQIAEWTSLEVLTLNGNNLTTLPEIDPMPNLRQLRLGDNPWHCDCRIKWMKRTLAGQAAVHSKCHRPALLQGRTIDTIDEQLMKCSGIEKRATTSCHETRVCPPVCTCTDTTVDCRDRGLTHIPANLPSSTTELRLEQNQITYIPPRAFHNLHQLRRLDLSKNSIIEVAPKAFEGLKSLNSLVLYGNSLTELPSEAFAGLGALQLLLLNANQLHCLRRGTFAPLQNLNLLSLYDNQLKSISNGTFANLTRLQTLHLAKNPLICDCNMEWLAEMLAEKAMETSGARCEGPKRVARRRLSTLSPAKFRCKGSEEFVTARADECIIDFTCPAACSCQGTVVDCSNRGLAEIPRDIPLFTTDLRLNKNKIGAVKSSTTLHRLVNLQRIDLSDNQISSIDHGAFSHLKSLVEVNLNFNRLRHFSSSIFGNSADKIQIVFLRFNLLQCLSPESLNGFASLRFLSLANNQLKCVTDGAFTALPRLQSLHLAGNEFICNCHIAGLQRFLQTNGSRLLDSALCAEPQALRSRTITSIQKNELQCTENACAENGNYCPSGCACQETIVRCSNKGLKAFPIGIPADTTELFLDSNDIESIPIQQLSRLANLTKLFVTAIIVNTPFRDLSHNRILVIENGTFMKLPQLSTLIISYNKLQCLEETAFDGLNSLRILSLHGNDLSVLPESAFRSLNNITHIALGSNSLYCNCRLSWFSRWIKAKFIEAGIARCETPLSLRNQLLLTSDASQLKCEERVPSSVLAKCDACVENPCKGDSKCVSTSGRGFRCECPPGYHGRFCEHEIDACYGHPCLNNATCKVVQEGRFTCVCPKGFEGDRCETNIDDCARNKCQNGATCVDMINTYRCDCPERYSGRYCEERLEYCSKKLNPCENGGYCNAEKDSYTCKCLDGFTGRNCSTNIDECEQHTCKNSAICLDGVNGYTCQCIMGFTGKFCDQPPMTNALYPNTDQCQGICQESEDESEVGCRCFSGYRGDKCDHLHAVGFNQATSYLALEPWQTDAGNLTLTLRTSNSTGVIAYYGDDSHIAAELYDGRVKVSFYVGNYPASHMYSYLTVNDGRPHVLEFRISGARLSLTIDGTQSQSVENTGSAKALRLESKQNLYLGGIPEQIAVGALKHFHLKQAASLHGCISDLFVNGESVDMEKPVEKRDIVTGCGDVVDLCLGADCGSGTCAANNSQPMGYQCKCQPGFTGERCDRREIQCVKEKFRRYHIEGECRSVEEVKSASCNGFCGAADCCQPSRVKRRRLKMHCKDGTTRFTTVSIVRKCHCASEPICPANV